MKTDVKTLSATKAGTIELADDIFGLDPRADILHRVVTWQLSCRQQGTHKTKGRSEVKGSGKKIYRQKGTGGARHGDKYSNIFRGGGTAHGPQVRSHATDLPKKVRKLGLRHALSAKVKAGELMIVDELKLKDAKTKVMVANIAKLGITNALFIDGSEVDEDFGRAIRNVPGIDVMPSQGANVYDILRRGTLVLSKAGVEALEARLK